MATEVLCPICGATYNLADDQVGKKVRCRKCEHAFVAGGKAPSARNRARDDEDDEDDRDDGIQERARSRSGKAARRKGAARDEEDDKPRRKTPSREEQAKPRASEDRIPVTTFVLAGVGLALILLVCGGGAFAVWQLTRGVQDGVNNAMNQAAQNAGVPQPPGGGLGNVPIPVPPGFPPVSKPIQNTEQALESLKAPEPHRRRDGAAWLAGAVPQEAQKPAVAAALEAALADGDGTVRAVAAQGLGTWGGPACVPALVKLVEQKDGQATERAIESLGRLKDPRGAAPLAALLKDFFQRGRAAAALQGMGRAAEKEVARYCFDADGGVRGEAQRLLSSYGSPQEVLLVQAVVDLKGPEEGRRQAAAEWLAKAVPVEARRAEVGQALEPLLYATDGHTRNTALAAVKVWGTAAHAEALAALLPDFFAHGAVKDALKAIGPPAAPAVAGCLFSPEPRAREAAAELLKGYGTKDDVVLTRAVEELKGTDREHRKLAAEYLAKMPTAVPARRAEVATALVPLLEDTDAATRSAAFRAARVWGTKDCVPGLLRQLADRELGAKDMRHLAMDALAEIKDERAVWPVVLCLTNFFDKDRAAKTLLAMGPVVATEAARQVRNVDPVARKVAWELLRDTGTPQLVDLPALKAAASKEPDPTVRATATAALKFIQAR